MPRGDEEYFEEEKYIQEVLQNAKAFAKRIKELNDELSEYRRLSTVQRVAYKGLDTQITNTLVDLDAEFTSLHKEVQSNNPQNIAYHLQRIETLSKYGLEDANKALDIAQNKKFDGASILSTIKKELTHFMQWAGKMLGLFNKHSNQLQNAMKKKTGGVLGLGAESYDQKFEQVKRDTGINLGQKGYELSKRQEDLVQDPEERPRHR